MSPVVMRFGLYRVAFEDDLCKIHLQAAFQHAVGLVLCLAASVGGMMLIFLQPVTRLSPDFGNLDWWAGIFLVLVGAVGLASLPFSIKSERRGITIDRVAKTLSRMGKVESFDLPGALAVVETTYGEDVNHSLMLALGRRRILLMSNLSQVEVKRGAAAINQFLGT